MEIDELSIVVKGDISDVQEKLDKLSGMMKNFGKSLSVSTGSSSNSATKQLNNDIRETSKNLDVIKAKYKDLGKDWKFTGSVQSAQIYLKNFTQQLENAKVQLQGLELDENVGSKAWANQIKNISILENKINILKSITESANNNLQDMSKVPISTNQSKIVDDLEEELEIREKIVNVAKEETNEFQKRNEEVKRSLLGIDFKKLFPYSPKELFGEVKGILQAKSQEKAISSGKLVETEEYRELGKEIDLVSAKIDKLKAKMKDKLSINPRYSKTDTYKGWENQLKSLEKEKRNKEDLQDSIELEGRRYEKASKSANNYADSLKKVSKQSSKAKSGISSIDKTLKNFTKSITKTTKMLKLMITRMILRGLISNTTNGFKNLIQWSDKVNASFSLIWNSFRQSGNAMSAMVAPLLVQLAPAIDKIIQLFIKAINVINQFFSALTGSGTWIRAKKLTDSYKESLNGASKAAKSLTMGIDELNILDDSSGGGGGSGNNVADMFEDAIVDEKIKSFSDKIKQMFEDLKKSDFGKNMADIFSSVFDFGIDIKNSSLKWLSELNFKPLQDAFTTLSESLKPFVDLVLGGLSFAYNEVLLPIGSWFMEDLAPTGIETVSKAIDLLVAILNDFKPIGEWLWNNLLKPIADWTGGVIVSVLEGIGNALEWISKNDTARAVLEGVAITIGAVATAIGVYNTVTTTAKAISEGFKLALAGINPTAVIITAALSLLVAGGIALYRNWDTIKAFASKTWTTIKTTIVDSITIIKNKIYSITNTIKNIWTVVWTSISNTTSTIWNGIWDSIKFVINGIIGGIEWMANSVVAGINLVIDALNMLSFDIPDWVPEFGGKKFGFSISHLEKIEIPKLATGGFPEDGLFFANHNELIGGFSNGKTAVANNDQIVSGIQNGVRSAVAEILAPYLSQIADNTRATANKDLTVNIGDRDIARANKRGQRSLGATIITQT